MVKFVLCCRLLALLFVFFLPSLPYFVSALSVLGQTNVPYDASACVGTWSWGNRVLYSYDSSDDERIIGAYQAAMAESSSPLFDTGDSYGTGALAGNAERLLKLGNGVYRHNHVGGELKKPIYIAKIANYPNLLSADSYFDRIVSSRERLGIRGKDDGYFIPSLHWSPVKYNPFQVEPCYLGLARAYKEGLCEGIGLSNVGGVELRKAVEFFDKRNVPIAVNQLQCSLISDIENDVAPALNVANECGITTLGYSPLSLGLLASHRTKRGFLRRTLFAQIDKDETGKLLLESLNAVADRNGLTPSQIALSWVRRAGLIPLFGSRDKDRVKENYAGSRFLLSDADFEQLEESRRNLKVTSTRNIFMTR